MKRWPLRLLTLALAVVVVFLVFETRQLAERLGLAERDAHRAARQSRPALQDASGQDAARHDAARHDAARQDAAGTDAAGVGAARPAADAPVDLAEYARLQLELHTTQQQLAAVTELLEQRNAQLVQSAEQAERRAREQLQPMPAGVRLCLDALHECLRQEGFSQQRFLRARALDDEGLRDVELLDAAADGLGAAFVQAARMTATVDRANGRLELRFYEGHRAVDGERVALPDDGLPMVFAEVDGRAFEERLPFLVRGDGDYPVEGPARGRPVGELDPAARGQWLRRIERLLAAAKTDVRWRPTRLRGLHDGRFLQVDLVGTDDRHHVVESAHCGRAVFEVDERRGVVSLWMLDGALRRGGLETTIGPEGYRMLLPGITPPQAVDALLGMVSKR